MPSSHGGFARALGCGLLAEHTAPGRLLQFVADAEHTECLVLPAANAFCVLAAQHVDEMHHAKSLAGTVGAGQGLAHRLAGVPGARWRQAVVAVAFVLLADEAQQLGARLFLVDDGVADVGTIEAGDEDPCVLQPEALERIGNSNTLPP